MDTERSSSLDVEFLRHTVATLAYRGGKALRGAPPAFASFRPAADTRSPAEILVHLGDLLDWCLGLADGVRRWPDSRPSAWEEDVQRFFASLAALDARLASGRELACPAARLFQGPIADALTHVGQIAMLRRMAGVPIRGENYYLADISAGRVGAEQAAPRKEFD
jgi:hypothetical protein